MLHIEPVCETSRSQHAGFLDRERWRGCGPGRSLHIGTLLHFKARRVLCGAGGRWRRPPSLPARPAGPFFSTPQPALRSLASRALAPISILNLFVTECDPMGGRWARCDGSPPGRVHIGSLQRWNPAPQTRERRPPARQIAEVGDAGTEPRRPARLHLPGALLAGSLCAPSCSTPLQYHPACCAC